MLRTDFTSQDYLRDPAAGLAKLRAAGPVVDVRFPSKQIMSWREQDTKKYCCASRSRFDASVAIEAARVFNDALAETVARNNPRFGAWAFLPLQDPPAAAEFTRCVRDLGFVGGHVASNVRGTYLHADTFRPVYEAATDLDVPLFVHPADPAGKDRTRDYELTVVAGYLFDNTINILNLVCSGFLDRWPRLKLVFAHTGAFSLVLRARIQCEVDTNPRRPYGHLSARSASILPASTSIRPVSIRRSCASQRRSCRWSIS